MRVELNFEGRRSRHDLAGRRRRARTILDELAFLPSTVTFFLSVVILTSSESLDVTSSNLLS